MFHSKTKHIHILKFCNRQLKYENKIVAFKMMHFKNRTFCNLKTGCFGAM